MRKIDLFIVFFKPNKNCQTVSKTLSITDHIFEKLKIYPNPTQNLLNISNDLLIDRVEVYILTGQKLMNISNNSNNFQIDISSLKAGVYLLKLANENNFKSIPIIKK